MENMGRLGIDCLGEGCGVIAIYTLTAPSHLAYLMGRRGIRLIFFLKPILLWHAFRPACRLAFNLHFLVLVRFQIICDVVLLG